MVQKIKNVIELTCSAVDFTSATDMQVYVKQGDTFFQYTPVFVSAHKLSFTIPKADALKLDDTYVDLQFAVTISGTPIVSLVKKVAVGELLRGDGYGI